MFGHSAIEWTSCEESVRLLPKSDTTDEKTKSILDLCKDSAPPCKLNPLLFNGHLQTIWASVGTHEDIPIHYKRYIFESDSSTYPGQFTVDFAVQPATDPAPRNSSLPPRTHNFSDEEWTDFTKDSSDDTPLIIFQHGLAGGSQEQYLRHTVRQVMKDGFAAVALNARGCAYSKLTTKYLFNARATWDMRQFVKWLRKTWPKRKIFAIGYSLGANILCNYIGEEGEDCQLEAACLVGSPWNLDVANAALETSYIGHNVYQYNMGIAMTKLFERHKHMITLNEGIDLKKVRDIKYLNEWDRFIQCPTWGYPTEHAYYRDASSSDSALNIRIPVLAIHAKDDPICQDIAVPYGIFKQNPYLVLCVTNGGGHIGFFETGGGRWYTTVAGKFFQKMFHETQGVKPPIAAKLSAEGRPVFDPLRRRLHVEDRIVL